MIEASCGHGVLSLRLPKAPHLRPKSIQVKAQGVGEEKRS